MSSNLLPSGLSAHELRSHMDCLRATKPPYTCPIANCDRVYKSFSGIQSHLTKFKHALSMGRNDEKMEETGNGLAHAVGRSDDPAAISGQQRASLQMSWTQAQKVIDVEVGGKIMRLNTLEPIPVSFVQGDEMVKTEEKRPDLLPLPRAVYKEIKEFEPTKMKSFPTSYIRYIEKTAEELDEEMEYDMDEEDDAWLDIINESRLRVGLPRVSEATFEYVLNRLEKDSYFKTSPGTLSVQDGAGPTAPGGGEAHLDEDDDTVCCVCGDGECDNSNAILFCDMCNLAVHQECYGVPYIPEGQWLCRRCQLSPSRGVDCRLCPNKGGAFKQTSDNGWAHVVCALWVPEVQFANTVFLEPIEGFNQIPSARWKLTCYICKQKARGACIQCHKPSCYTAFHVTCAQQAGLYMKMETVHDPKSSDGGITVRKSAFCDLHAPNGNSTIAEEKVKKNGKTGLELKKRQSEASHIAPKFDMRRARKLLSQKRKLSPTVSVPVVPRRKLEQLAHQLRFAGKQEFLDRVLRYWTLKRRSRFGVPLLRRLQVTHHASRLERERTRNKALQEQYKSWRQLRQDLEKARLLMELVRKRERQKKEYSQVVGETWEELLWGRQRFLIATIDELQEIDEKRVFTQPVDDEEVPGYSRIIKCPMDLSTMRKKVEQLEYNDFGQMEKDFDQMMANCMKFNVQNEYYKSYGIKYKKQGLEILRRANQAYLQMQECRVQSLVELQRYEQRDDADQSLVTTVPATPPVIDEPTISKKGVAKKQKVTALTKPRRSQNEESSFGDMPKLVACEPADGKSKPAKASSEILSSKGSKRASPLPTASETAQTKSGKKGPKPVSSAKKQFTKLNTPPATPTSRPKKSQQKRAGKSETSRKDESDEDDGKPLTALLGQTQNSLKMAAEKAHFATPVDVAEPARPSFRVFREDRKSPNSSAVESEMEPASGDEGGYMRAKALMASTSTVDVTLVEQLSPEHLDFVWAHVEGRPWLPGVVIDPNIEYGPQSAVRYVPTEAVLNQRLDNAYLVMLFDENNSWFWLKRNCIHMLGLDPETDKKRLQEAGLAQGTVIRAYERALEARNLVTGDDMEVDEDQSGPPVIDEYRSSDEEATESSATSA